MSEYQRYEFMASDRSLTRAQLNAVNTLSSRNGSWKSRARWFRERRSKRQRLASLTRKCRHAARRLATLESGMWLLGCTYNFCAPHHELSRRAAKAQGKPGVVLLTPAMASGLTDHVWSIWELLSYRVAPAPWVAPKRRRRPTKQTEPHVRSQQSSSQQPRRRPLLSLQKGVLCSTTS